VAFTTLKIWDVAFKVHIPEPGGANINAFVFSYATNIRTTDFAVGISATELKEMKGICSSIYSVVLKTTYHR
jgi:hypothetical protein